MFALLAALCAAPAARPAGAAEEQKVWRALTEEDRRARTRPAPPSPALPGGIGGSAAAVSRDQILAYLIAGIVVAVFAGIGVAVLASARWPRQVPKPPRPADLEAGSELERVWSFHMTRKRRERGPRV